MSHRKMKGHTGKIRHKDMKNILHGEGKKDPLAHSSHNQANAKHDMEAGCSPGENCEKMEGGMAGDNCEYE